VRHTLRISTALLLALGMLASCGGSGGGVANPGQLANIAGPWHAVATSTANAGSTAALFVNVTQTTGTFFANNSNIVLCAPANATDIPNGCVWVNPTQPAGYTISIDGTIQANGAVQITVTETQSIFCDNSGTQTNCTVTLTGNVNSSATQISGTYTSSTGDKGTWQATPGTSVTGTYSGSLNSPNNPPAPISVNGNLTQNPDFTLTGAASVTGSACFTALNITSGSAIGGAFFFTDSTNSVTVGAIPLGNNQWQAGYYVYAGGCQLNSNNGVLTHQ
jgi:hypothetical protein